jgi:superoxide dismutase, Cu-Zn family
MQRSITLAGWLGFVVLSFGCGAEPETVSETSEGVHRASARAVVRDATGNVVAAVRFRSDHGAVRVSTEARFAPELAGFHGFHVHANDNAANGVGCVADPAQPANTHFVSADGHFNPTGETHGNHSGDMPALGLMDDGRGSLEFLTDHFTVADIVGRAVVIHQNPDNYGNVPVGAAANQYTPNAPDATTLTQNTGNAGNRIGCGLIE